MMRLRRIFTPEIKILPLNPSPPRMSLRMLRARAAAGNCCASNRAWLGELHQEIGRLPQHRSQAVQARGRLRQHNSLSQHQGTKQTGNAQIE